ncbi:MAG: SDR family NAD(P)-dependent oxidoreductase [Acidimicrobiia bacterium]
MTATWNGWLPDGGLLEGKVALVAGGAGGIGEATSRILAAAGATVAVVDRDAERANATAKELTEAGGAALAVTADLFDEDACNAAVDTTVAELGGLDVLANVAGGMSAHAPWAPITEWPTDTWDHITHLNQRYVFWMCRAAIPAMVSGGKGGAIVNVTSIAGSFGSPGQSAYGAAKAGLLQFTKTLAIECGPLGIRANAVAPGLTLTEPAAALPEETKAQLATLTPLRELCTPEDIARGILVFASPITHGVTGQMIHVDAGISVNFPYPGIGHQ